jgi:phage-related protein
MVGDNFSYCNHRLSDFGLVMMKPETEDEIGLNREILKGSTTIHRKEPIVYGVNYTDVLIIHLFIVKDDEVYDDKTFSVSETREIESWLTNNTKPEILKIEFNENPSIEYHGVFTEISPFIVNGLNGLYLTFTCTSPFAYETNSIYFVNSAENYKKNFNCTSDDNDYVYPIIKIKPSQTGTFSIKNVDENKTMQFKLNSSYDEYVIDCKLKRIIADGNVLSMGDVEWTITNVVSNNSGSSNDFGLGTISLYWLRFLPGVNHLVFNGSGEFNISCKSPVKVGGIPYA